MEILIASHHNASKGGQAGNDLLTESFGTDFVYLRFIVHFFKKTMSHGLSTSGDHNLESLVVV